MDVEGKEDTGQATGEDDDVVGRHVESQLQGELSRVHLSKFWDVFPQCEGGLAGQSLRCRRASTPGTPRMTR